MKKNWPIIVGSIILSVIVIFYFSVFHAGPSHEDTSWANFGSYVGGSAGSIFSFITLVYVVRSFNQEKEAKENAKEELTKQRREREQEKIQNIFFKSLELLNTCVNNLVLSNTCAGVLSIRAYVKFVDEKIQYAYEVYGSMISQCSSQVEIDCISTPWDQIVLETNNEYNRLLNVVQPFINFMNVLISQYVETAKENYNIQDNKQYICSLLSKEEKLTLIYTGTVQYTFFNDYIEVTELNYYRKMLEKFNICKVFIFHLTRE